MDETREMTTAEYIDFLYKATAPQNSKFRKQYGVFSKRTERIVIRVSAVELALYRLFAFRDNQTVQNFVRTMVTAELRERANKLASVFRPGGKLSLWGLIVLGFEQLSEDERVEFLEAAHEDIRTELITALQRQPV